jgi:hypothetical protein
MKVFVECEAWMSLGIKRVVNALKEYKPAGVQIVNRQEDAELTVVHMVGNGQRKHWTSDKRPAPYAVIQYCLRTSELPDTKDWIDVWHRARCVWSYYDLMQKILEDKHDTTETPIHFYHAPLGVDTRVFRPSLPARKQFLIGTSGYIPQTEGVIECAAVCEQMNRLMFHLGPNLNIGNGVTYGTGMPDRLLADFWSRCSFVAGLRRIEGFELPVVEGLTCGARPIVFDAPHYRDWFGDHAEYVPEVSPEELIPHLMDVMSKPVRAVTPAERSQVAHIFDWKTLVTGFWEAVL